MSQPRASKLLSGVITAPQKNVSEEKHGEVSIATALLGLLATPLKQEENVPIICTEWTD